jgi:hypothetical protein
LKRERSKFPLIHSRVDVHVIHALHCHTLVPIKSIFDRGEVSLQPSFNHLRLHDWSKSFPDFLGGPILKHHLLELGHDVLIEEFKLRELVESCGSFVSLEDRRGYCVLLFFSAHGSYETPG